jgi:hypothetical protein
MAYPPLFLKNSVWLNPAIAHQARSGNGRWARLCSRAGRKRHPEVHVRFSQHLLMARLREYFMVFIDME